MLLCLSRSSELESSFESAVAGGLTQTRPVTRCLIIRRAYRALMLHGITFYVSLPNIVYLLKLTCTACCNL